MAGTADKLLYLYPASTPNVDWVVVSIDGAETIENWNPALGAQPTQAELDAVTDQQISDARDTAYAQAEKAEAIKGVDDALAQHGGRVERAIMSVAFSISKAVNKDRETLAAMNAAIQAATTLADLKARMGAIPFPAQVSPQQVSDAVKAAIAETPE